MWTRGDARARVLRQLRCLDATGQDLRRQGYAYRSPHDFVLQHGIWYAPRRLPLPYRRGLPRCCFANALLVAARHGLRYVEGYASWRGLVFHHAWAVTAADRLLDVTWPELGQAYLGVEFSLERADHCSWIGDATVLEDHRRSWPLLRQPWVGENPLAVWEPSPWLDLVRAGRLEEARAWVTAQRAEEEASRTVIESQTRRSRPQAGSPGRD